MSLGIILANFHDLFSLWRPREIQLLPARPKHYFDVKNSSFCNKKNLINVEAFALKVETFRKSFANFSGTLSRVFRLLCLKS